MKSIKKETGGEMEVLLSSDSVLAVNPRVTFRWSNKSADADNRTRQGQAIQGPVGAPADESVGLPTLKPEERTLLALADGRRSIESLAKLAGMTTPVAVRHLRALYDRGILVANDKSGSSVDTGEAPTPSAVAEALGMKVASAEPDSGVVAPVVASGGGGEVESSGRKSSGAVEATVPTAVSSSSPAPAPSASTDKSGPAVRKHPSGPNVTLFWTPASSDSGSVSDGSGPTGKSTTPGVEAVASTTPRPRRNSPVPAVVVIGSPDSSAGTASAAKANGTDAAKDASKDPAKDLAKDLAKDPARNPAVPEPTVIVRSSATVVVSDAAAAARPEPAAAKSDARAEARTEARTEDGAVPSGQETPAPSVAIPFQVGSYEVATRIAQGAMGSIYVCRRVGAAGFQRLFTLKVIRQYSNQKEIAAKSFMREAQFGAMLNHPNIQTLVDVGNYDGQPFLILDYIEGTSLLDLISDDRRPSAAIVVAVMMDLLRGLQHVHDVSDENGNRLGMVHGDVSPHNVLVGVDGVARLTDFGSARFAKPGDGHHEVAAGKPAYMAPEQLRGESVDARTDLFSVGVTMWTALTGQKLFAADTYDETAVRVMRRKVPPPSEFGAPACLDAVVLRALSRSPEGRYSSADEMARDLQAVATTEHLVAPGRDVGQWVRREFGEALADRKRKIQEAFGVPSARSEGATSQASQGASAPQPRRPHRPTPKTADGLERLPAKTLLLEAGEIQAALGAAKAEQAAHRQRAYRPTREASRGQWAVVIVSAVIAAFALTAAIIYLVSSLNTPPRRPPAGVPANAPGAVAPTGPAVPAEPAAPGAPPSNSQQLR